MILLTVAPTNHEHLYNLYNPYIYTIIAPHMSLLLSSLFVHMCGDAFLSPYTLVGSYLSHQSEKIGNGEIILIDHVTIARCTCHFYHILIFLYVVVKIRDPSDRCTHKPRTSIQFIQSIHLYNHCTTYVTSSLISICTYVW